jgi:YHS domain-containing protein/tetratricopeptide (TPR) repeat protein
VWCERCQRPASLPTDVESARCAQCGEPLTLGDPRFEEIYGQIQNLVAVLEAGRGDPARLATLVPERPRFLSDLDPPESSATDDDVSRASLELLRAGAFVEARQRLEAILESRSQGDGARARLWQALAVARQRVGDLSGAEAAFTRVLEIDPSHEIARLGRGALRARRADFDGARADLEGAGSRIEARWNRAALSVLEAVSLGTGVPDPARLEAARREAGPPSSYWSDHTVGRLLFTLLVERAAARGPDACGDARVLRAAEGELEFDTFDDRALVLLGYARLAITDEAQRVAGPLAERLTRTLAEEPFAHGERGASSPRRSISPPAMWRPGTSREPTRASRRCSSAPTSSITAFLARVAESAPSGSNRSKTLRTTPRHPGLDGGVRMEPMSSVPVAPSPDTTQERDPVCGMTVRPTSPHQTTFRGRTYRFCGAGCLAKFTADPDRYLTPKPKDPGAGVSASVHVHEAGEYTCPMDPEVRSASPGACPKCGMALEPADIAAPVTKTEWTCPMHPQIVRNVPGSCPICGMALEPRTLALAEEENPELVDMRMRFRVCVALTAPLVLMMVGALWPGEPIHRVMPVAVARWAELLLATPVVLWVDGRSSCVSGSRS